MADRTPGLGPLGGILTALRHRPGESVFVLACDLPGVTPELVAWLVDRARSTSSPRSESRRTEPRPVEPRVVFPRVAGTAQPLCGVWSAACAGEIEQSLQRGERSVTALLARLEDSPIDLPDTHPVFRSDLLANLNRAGDLEAAGAVAPPTLAVPSSGAALR